MTKQLEEEDPCLSDDDSDNEMIGGSVSNIVDLCLVFIGRIKNSFVINLKRAGADNSRF